MEIIKPNANTLCNYEVMQILQKLKETTQKKHKREGSLATVTYETLRYLQDTECKYQNETAIENIMNALKPFKLTKTEKLMIINTPPRTPLEIQLVIQESEERLTDDQVDELLKIIDATLPKEAPSTVS